MPIQCCAGDNIFLYFRLLMRGLAKQSRHIMFTEQQLVSFGNFLLLTYGVSVHSTDGKNTPLYPREITDADFCNWKENEKPSINVLPSRFQLNDFVSVKFRPDFVIEKAKIIKVHFTESKVLYDLQVEIGGQTPLTSTRVYNVDSLIVESV